ncbi:MAG: DUF3857 domain-containing protein [Candidatus Omnitrophica bacterium]|nr:DUF3857 domain-containing protein [Candidatus Omnitrophota bacterium]MDD5652603.1 DUF3857 domain-containing protein [Candidatus Omnitrophota bacterium]
MRIIDTVKLKLVLFLSLSLLFLGCKQIKDDSQAQEYTKISQQYYQQAISAYKSLIAQGKDLDRIYFELGKLYFAHGDYNNAILELKHSQSEAAKKYLAIAYYYASNFSEALDLFSKDGFLDDESSYYYGLTAEKLNLFDTALKAYQKIAAGKFKLLAQGRVDSIEMQSSLANIKEVSPEVSRIIEQAPSEKEYPQAGGIILLSDEKIKVTQDAKEISELHYLVKILNERGKQNYAESQIDYDSTFERIELDYARTIKPDGTVVEVGSRHIRDVSKYLNFPLYSNAHVYIISFPEVTEGAVIEYKVKIIRNQLINKKDIVLGFPVQTADPILLADFNLELPKTLKLQRKILNEKFNDFGADLSPKVSEESNRVVYHWQFKKIPQILPEANMPPEVEINPTIMLSTFGSWQEIFDWWWGLAKDKIRADDAIKSKVRELIKNQKDPEGKIRQIYNFCCQEIRYVAVEYGQAGYEPHFAVDTFKNKYGDCKDKAILLVTMLREAGFSAWPLLISTKEYYNLNDDFPSMLFNHAIAAIALGGKTVFMDSTAQTCSFGDLPQGDQNRKVLIFKPEGYSIEPTPMFAAEHNLVKQSLKISVKPDESIFAQKTNSTFGIYDQAQRYWLLYTPPELIAEALKEKIQDISIGAKLGDYQIKNLDDLNTPVELDYSFNGPEYLIVAGPLRILPALASLDTSLVARDKRKYPIDFGSPETKESDFEIAIPGNFAIKYIPETINEDSPWIRFNIAYSRQGNKLLVSQRVALKQEYVKEADYQDFKAFFENLAKKIKQRAILEKIK